MNKIVKWRKKTVKHAERAMKYRPSEATTGDTFNTPMERIDIVISYCSCN